MKMTGATGEDDDGRERWVGARDASHLEPQVFFFFPFSLSIYFYLQVFLEEIG